MKLPKYWSILTPFSKTVSLILFIALLFIIFWVGYNFKRASVLTSNSVSIKQPVDMSKWNTYTDKVNGITFHYPNNLILNDGSPRSPSGSYFISIWPEGGIAGLGIPKDTYPNTNFSFAGIDFNVNKKLSASDCQLFKYGTDIEQLTSSINIGGYNFYYYFYTYNRELHSEPILFKLKIYHIYRNNACYEITTSLGALTDNTGGSTEIIHVNDTVENLLDQVVSTFKFIN